MGGMILVVTDPGVTKYNRSYDGCGYKDEASDRERLVHRSHDGCGHKE